jgi:agmatine/peptidylarginine deiminase
MRTYTFIILLLAVQLSAAQAQPLNPWTPPEYFPAKAVLIEWDFNANIWPLYAQLIRECRTAAEVILVVRDQGEQNQMTQRLLNDGVPLDNISFVHLPCERMWIRDHGPLAVHTDEGTVFIDFDDLANSGLDEDLPTNLAQLWGLTAYQFPYIFCGGNFMVDSYGTLFTTTRLYGNNPGYPRAEIDQVFADYMGINQIVTVSPQHNDYWGHIDMQIKLLDDTTFIISSAAPGSGPNHDSLELNYERLAALTAPHGKPYRIERLPMADNWKTYVNSLILNDKVIIPIYHHPLDSVAYELYRRLLPEHEIVGIDCNPIIGWEGAVHCITMQLFDEAPLAVAASERRPAAQALGLFPNPISAGQELQLSLPEELLPQAQVFIYDSSGKLVQSGRPGQLRWQLPAGAYVVEAITPAGLFSGRVIGR